MNLFFTLLIIQQIDALLFIVVRLVPHVQRKLVPERIFADNAGGMKPAPHIIILIAPALVLFVKTIHFEIILP